MAAKGYCGNFCAKCSVDCYLDGKIPCSPDCKNLTEDGKILVSNCLADSCEEVRYIFDMIGSTDAEIIERYGAVAEYPYTLK